MNSAQARAWVRAVGGVREQSGSGFRVLVNGWRLNVHEHYLVLTKPPLGRVKHRFPLYLGQRLAVEWVKTNAVAEPLALEDWLSRRQ